MSGNRPKAYLEPLHIRARANRQQPKGLPIVNLSFNELPFAPTAHVQQAIIHVANNAHCYGHPSCEPLREKIAKTFSLNKEQIICGNGSEELLDIIGRVFARRGDEILISEFGYIQFPIVCNRVDATLVKARETNRCTAVDAMLEATGAKTKLVFLANPNNPTGTMISTEEVKRLATALPTSTVLVVDLAYVEFADNRVNGEHCRSMHELAGALDNLIVTQTFSKAFGIAGLRVGWCHAPEWMMPVLNSARAMGPVNAAAQAAAIAALEDLSAINLRVKTIVDERIRMTQQLCELGYFVVPSHANFLLCAYSDERVPNARQIADRMADYLYDEVGILVNRTREAGLENFIRFSLSTAEKNEVLLQCMAKFKQVTN